MRLVNRDLMINSVKGFGSAIQDLCLSGNTYSAPVVLVDDNSGAYTIFDRDGYPLGDIWVAASGEIVSIIPHEIDIQVSIFCREFWTVQILV